MKIIRFVTNDGRTLYGSDYDGSSAFVLDGDPLGNCIITEEKAQVKKLLAPVVPTQILCIGLNYKAHIEETKLETPDFPVLFTKNIASVLNPFEDILIPECCREKPQVDYEGELAVVIGKDAKNVKAEDAMEYIAGCTAGNDISERAQQFKNGGQWIRGKSFDTFCPLGPTLIKDSDPDNLNIKTYLNGELMQNSNTSDMLFSTKELIEKLSMDTTLKKGTVILTGTPSGVGFSRTPPVYLKDGDKVEVEIEKIGSLINGVKG